MTLVEVKNVYKSFDQGEITVEVLKNINFSVNRGEFVCIMGASGSGKTSLLQLLGALDRPTSGGVFVEGDCISDLKEKELALYRRQKLGFVFQQFNLIPVLSAEENVALPLLLNKKSQLFSTERARDLLKMVGLDKHNKHRPSQLSGGQQQRVAIARALSTNPSLLLADEPTGALDSKTSKEVIKLLRVACDELKQTTIVVTHDSFVAAYADRIVILADGKIENDFLLQGDWTQRDIPQQIEVIQREINTVLSNQEVRT